MTVRTVLVIAQEGDLRRIRTLLEREGFAVAEASNGLEGVRQFSQTQPDLVILDEWPPDLDGWRVVEQVRRRSDEVPSSSSAPIQTRCMAWMLAPTGATSHRAG